MRSIGVVACVFLGLTGCADRKTDGTVSHERASQECKHHGGVHVFKMDGPQPYVKCYDGTRKELS